MAYNHHTFTDIKNLFQIAKAFREAFETIGRSYNYGFLHSFPEGCCTWASIFIGNFLKEEYALHPKRVFSESQHEWTLVNDFIIDITADQFDNSLSPVIVVKESAWHNMLRVREIEDYSPASKYDNPHEKHRVSDIYKHIISRVFEKLESEKILN